MDYIEAWRRVKDGGAFDNWYCRGNGSDSTAFGVDIDFLAACKWVYSRDVVTKAQPTDPQHWYTWHCYGLK